MGLREEKKRATRAALSWAAIRLVVERGYDGVLVEDIAAAAGVSPRTFNNYFGSKAEALASRHLDRCLAVADALRSRPPGEPLWTAMTEAVVAQFVPGPEVTQNPRPDRDTWLPGLRLMLAVPAVQAETLRAGATAESALAAAIADRTGTDADTDLYPKLTAAAVLAAGNAASQVYAQQRHAGHEPDIRALLTEALHLLEAGLPPPSP